MWYVTWSCSYKDICCVQIGSKNKMHEYKLITLLFEHTNPIRSHLSIPGRSQAEEAAGCTCTAGACARWRFSGVASAWGATVVTGVQRADCREHNVSHNPDSPAPAAQPAVPIFICCQIFKSSLLLITKSLFLLLGCCFFYWNCQMLHFWLINLIIIRL